MNDFDIDPNWQHEPDGSYWRSSCPLVDLRVFRSDGGWWLMTFMDKEGDLPPKGPFLSAHAAMCAADRAEIEADEARERAELHELVERVTILSAALNGVINQINSHLGVGSSH